MFIYVYRLAIDARPKWGDVVTGRKYPSLLEGFPDGHSINGSPETSCINRKGFIRFLSYSNHRTDASQALCCLEGSTMSNLVHRRRRCARIVQHMILCREGSTPEDRYLTRRRLSLWLQWSLYFTVNGSYFVFWGHRRYCKPRLGVTAWGCCQDAS